MNKTKWSLFFNEIILEQCPMNYFHRITTIRHINLCCWNTRKQL